MDKFKLAHFERAHPGVSPPAIDALSPPEALAVRRLLASRLGLDQHVSPEDLVTFLDHRQTVMPHVNADGDGFSLSAALRSENIVPAKYVLLNWYQFDELDRVSWSDLSTFFDDIWYPASDDIDIFAASCDWVLSVHHSGTLKVLHLET